MLVSEILNQVLPYFELHLTLNNVKYYRIKSDYVMRISSDPRNDCNIQIYLITVSGPSTLFEDGFFKVEFKQSFYDDQVSDVGKWSDTNFRGNIEIYKVSEPILRLQHE